MMTESNTDEEQVSQTEEVVEEQVEQLSEVEQLEHALDEANEAKLRALADFKNFQKRSYENEVRATNGAMARIVRAILPAIEQMNMAIEHAGDDVVVQGFQMALDGLLHGLAECGVEIIAPDVGDPFDPQMHEAMMRQDAENMDIDHIVMVMQTGFRLGDIVISPAKVAVSN
jgi:molecular chaperone GrpE|tara:strand:+ start:2813 stop:3328 length:516 start_codon:yes stop_codon:yes gene_type:complete